MLRYVRLHAFLFVLVNLLNLALVFVGSSGYNIGC